LSYNLLSVWIVFVYCLTPSVDARKINGEFEPGHSCTNVSQFFWFSE